MCVFKLNLFTYFMADQSYLFLGTSWVFGDNEICMVLFGTMTSTHVSMRMRPPSMSRMAHALHIA